MRTRCSHWALSGVHVNEVAINAVVLQQRVATTAGIRDHGEYVSSLHDKSGAVGQRTVPHSLRERWQRTFSLSTLVVATGPRHGHSSRVPVTGPRHGSHWRVMVSGIAYC
jgi:hypothetical protein